jgi:hypothetical protein
MLKSYHTCNAGSALRVPVARFDGPQRSGPAGRSGPSGYPPGPARPTQGLPQSADLDRVAQRRPGPVHGDKTDAFRTPRGAVRHLANQETLRGPVGRRQPAGPPVLVDSRVRNNADHARACA